MPEKILYYIGAGASAEALPVVKKQSEELKGLSASIAYLSKRISDMIVPPNIDANEVRTLCANLSWLAENGEKFTTIDTFAKYLYLKNRTDYERLKNTLSIYFSIEQLWENKIDKRYMVWLASILSRNQFPEEIKIVSWNYDFQFQLTADMFKSENHFYSNGVTRSETPFIHYYPNIHKGYLDENFLSLVQLNGIAGFLPGNSALEDHIYLKRENDIWTIIKHLLNGKEYNKLSFGWENSKAKNYACKMVENTTIIVVIGYSFPFFNREIDGQIFESIKSTGQLKKIYFQDPFLDGSFLKSQLNINVPIMHIDRKDSFYIPFEL